MDYKMYNQGLPTKEFKMKSNSKLTAEQKVELTSMRVHADINDITTAFLDNVTTMVYRNCGNTVHFALAIKSEDEKKFRPNVGEYLALDKFMAGHYVVMQRTMFETMLHSLWNITLD